MTAFQHITHEQNIRLKRRSIRLGNEQGKIKRKINREKIIDVAFNFNPNALIVSLKANGAIIDVNEGFVKLFEYSREEAIGNSTISLKLYVNAQDRKTLLELLNDRDRILNHEMNMRKRSGHITPVLISAERVLTDNTEILIISIQEISQIRKAQQELHRSKEKAEENSRKKSAFLANVSHEIRTPMNGILGFTQLLKNTTISQDTRNKYINVLESSAMRMLGIINDLIDMSRIEAGLIEIRKEITDIRELINELVMMFTPESERKGLLLFSTIKESVTGIKIKTDKTKLGQILTNLIKNAIKFTDIGGKIEVGCALQKESRLIFWVKDNGIGIEKGKQKEIFERFKQEDTTYRHEGLGLGLAISRAYVEMLGGNIYVESEPGIGSVFSFILPFNPAEGETGLMEIETPVKLLPFMNVLIAEDDDISYFYLKESLRRKEIVSSRVKNGLEAVKAIENNSDFNLILMDIKMPVMNGTEAIRQIKSIKPEIPIIAQSAFATDIDIHMAFEAGCNDYITKPIDINSLFKKISAFTSTGRHII